MRVVVDIYLCVEPVAMSVVGSAKGETLGTLQFKKKHAASRNTVVRSCITMIMSSILGIDEFKVTSQRTTQLLKTLISDVLVHGMAALELDLVALEVWVREREQILEPELERALRGVRAYADRTDFRPRRDFEQYTQRWKAATMRVVESGRRCFDALGSFSQAEGTIDRVNALMNGLYEAQKRQVAVNTLWGSGDAAQELAALEKRGGKRNKKKKKRKKKKKGHKRAKKDEPARDGEGGASSSSSSSSSSSEYDSEDGDGKDEGDKKPPVPRDGRRSRRKAGKGRGKEKGQEPSCVPGDTEVLEVDLDAWQYLFVAPEKTDTSNMEYVLGVIARFFRRMDPCAEDLVRRPKTLNDEGHPLWRHSMQDGHVYFFQGRAGLPVLTGTVNHMQQIDSPCGAVWPLVVQQYVLEKTDKAVAAQHAARLIFASSEFSGGSAPKSLRSAEELMRERAEALRQDQRLLQNPLGSGGEGSSGYGMSLEPGVGDLLQTDKFASRVISDATRQAAMTMKAAHDFDREMDKVRRQAHLMPNTESEGGAFAGVEDDYKRHAEHFALQVLAGRRITDRVAAEAYDPNLTAKEEHMRKEMRAVFCLTDALVDPTASTKATGQAKRSFEMMVNDTARSVLHVINVFADLLGLPEIAIDGFEEFEITDAEEEMALLAARAKLDTIKVQMEAAKTQLETAKKQKMMPAGGTKK